MTSHVNNISSSTMVSRVQPERVRLLNNRPHGRGPVLYWMHRDHRVRDNWALLYAADLALEARVPLVVAFTPNAIPGISLRQQGFSLRSMLRTELDLLLVNVPLVVLTGSPFEELRSLAARLEAGAVVADFSPLREFRVAVGRLTDALPVSMYEVDAHNIVPAWVASHKEEVGARTLRPKIQRLLPQFLTEFPAMEYHPYSLSSKAIAGYYPLAEQRLSMLNHADHAAAEVRWIRPGEDAAREALESFLSKRAAGYDERRNDPSHDGQSGLSPYIHFGHLAAQRIALEVRKAPLPEAARDAFLEELIVRRELSDNYCLYNPCYDSFAGFPAWARKSLDDHRSDPRPHRYSDAQLEDGKTADPLWNAAQLQMVHLGKMHGYMRMYWAKKLLEWLPSPEQAQAQAIRLNDRWSLDGNDPNGYTGIAWSIGGVHDRAWFDRPVFGKVRYMNSNGAASKFNVRAYIDSVLRLAA